MAAGATYNDRRPFHVSAGCFRVMLPAKRAPVRPRVLSSQSGETLLLEEEILRFVDEGATVSGARLNQADFSGAKLREAKLAGLVLAHARFDGADFTRAQLMGSDFEVNDLEGLLIAEACFVEARLDGATLTGSIMPAANFHNAFLRGAYLGGIEWEDADLRGADLRGATFHMGSSRSGLVGSPIASEGSRTGFYTDDFEEQYFKAPEEIRKANLCGADLRGALIDDVDFYLVDVRGAKYDAQQERHLRRCRAIHGK